MVKYDLVFRDYKGVKNPKGWYLLVNGRQTNYYGLNLSEKQRKSILHDLKMHQYGYSRINEKTYRMQEKEDLITEVKELEHNYEVTDIKKDPDTHKWKKEKSETRDYTDLNEDDLDKVL